MLTIFSLLNKEIVFSPNFRLPESLSGDWQPLAALNDKWLLERHIQINEAADFVVLCPCGRGIFWKKTNKQENSFKDKWPLFCVCSSDVYRFSFI